jgi:hypothetical protein
MANVRMTDDKLGRPCRDTSGHCMGKHRRNLTGWVEEKPRKNFRENNAIF